jgi:hypothetical protein
MKTAQERYIFRITPGMMPKGKDAVAISLQQSMISSARFNVSTEGL